MASEQENKLGKYTENKCIFIYMHTLCIFMAYLLYNKIDKN